MGPVLFSWQPDGNLLASVGKNGVVQIANRHGDILDEVPMTSSAPVLALSWDKDGELLAVLQEGNGVIALWSNSTRRVTPLDTNLKDPTFIAWSRTGPQLAVGTAKGNLLIYNKAKKQKIPIIGKHGKKISCGGWSRTGNKLALGSEDKNLTISNESGDTLIQTEVKNMCWSMDFSINRYVGPSNKVDDLVCANLGGKSLLLFGIGNDADDPIELTFSSMDGSKGSHYGDIVTHLFYDGGMLMIGFSKGFLVAVSTFPQDLGEEKYVGRFHTSNMLTFSYNPSLRKAATCGFDGVRIVDTRDFKEISSDFISSSDLEDGRVTDIAWSPDGTILTVGTDSGNVYNFLAKMSVLHARYGTSIAYLSSLREATVVDASKKNRTIDVPLKLEPAYLALGTKHLAAGMNNKVFFHKLTEKSMVIVNEQEYVGTVKEVQLNSSFAAVLLEAKAVLHPIEDVNSGTRSNYSMNFPIRSEGSYSEISCIALTENFLYYGTEAGTVEVFCLAEWQMLSGAELRIDYAVKKICPNSVGTRVVILDFSNRILLYNPVLGGGINQSITKFEFSPPAVVSIMWDAIETNVIYVYDGKNLHTYAYAAGSMKGALLTKLGIVDISAEGDVTLTPASTEMMPGNLPVMCCGGTLVSQTTSGGLLNSTHPFFDQLDESAERKLRSKQTLGKAEEKILMNRFCQAIALLKLETAWETALELDLRNFWIALGGKAMELLQIELATRVYRQLGDAGMVMALQQLMNIEDRNLLSGHLCLLFGDYVRAQELFLSSSNPTEALTMRRNLLHWEQALKLAQTLNQASIPEICAYYGQQLEYKDDTEQALSMYESALQDSETKGEMKSLPDSLITLARMGLARCHLKLGNIRQGLRICNDMNSNALMVDCGDILERQKQYSESVALYIKAGEYEKAGYIYVNYLIKNDSNSISEAAKIMANVTNGHLNSSFAKACAAAKRYEEAAVAYERAKDYDKVVELKLKFLDQIQEAFDIVRSSFSANGAVLIADYCQEKQDFSGAIEFLLIAGKSEDAFKLAQMHNKMDTYTTILGDHIPAEDAIKVAHHYEKLRDYGKAGKYYAYSAQYPRALKLFLQCGDKEIDSAIDVVGKSQNESLTHELIDFLIGDRDGVPKDPNYIYRLYMALKKYEEAGKTALIIAKQEQEAGNYNVAHSVITETVMSLESAGIRVSLTLRQQFILLHSYIRVKGLVKQGDHLSAARMLLRVAQNVSRFPLHIVPILCSTVIECHRAGLKSSAFEYAVVLMRPENRQNIAPALKKKIEAIVRRKSIQGDEPPEELSPCPISGQQIPVSQLECPTTRDAIPMCIVTGRHMILEDWCFCPNSRFPALYSKYVEYIKNEALSKIDVDEEEEEGKEGPALDGPKNAVDPVLGKPVYIEDLKLITSAEASEYIKRYNNVKDEPEKKKDSKDRKNDGLSEDPETSPV